MALTNQPYLPLYVNDWMSNNKLKDCSLASHGLMISIMCLMHKEDSYGKLLLKQKYKQIWQQNTEQTDKQILSFASQLARLLAFDVADITPALQELIEEKVLILDNDILICDRMVRDAEISTSRAFSGRNGGRKTQENIHDFAKANAKANVEANAAIAIANANAINITKELESLQNTIIPKELLLCNAMQRKNLEDFISSYFAGLTNLPQFFEPAEEARKFCDKVFSESTTNKIKDREAFLKSWIKNFSNIKNITNGKSHKRSDAGYSKQQTNGLVIPTSGRVFKNSKTD